MKGYLESQVGETIASQHCIGMSLQRVNPDYHQQRLQHTERQTNPIPYHADYHGHKLQGHSMSNHQILWQNVTQHFRFCSFLYY